MKCERTHERHRPDGSVERWTTVETMEETNINTDPEALAEFKRLGNRASVHLSQTYGDHPMAYSLIRRAMEIYRANPELQERMREIARGFLWSIE